MGHQPGEHPDCDELVCLAGVMFGFVEGARSSTEACVQGRVPNNVHTDLHWALTMIS